MGSNKCRYEPLSLSHLYCCLISEDLLVDTLLDKHVTLSVHNGTNAPLGYAYGGIPIVLVFSPPRRLTQPGHPRVTSVSGSESCRANRNTCASWCLSEGYIKRRSAPPIMEPHGMC